METNRLFVYASLEVDLYHTDGTHFQKDAYPPPLGAMGAFFLLSMGITSILLVGETYPLSSSGHDQPYAFGLSKSADLWE